MSHTEIGLLLLAAAIAMFGGLELFLLHRCVRRLERELRDAKEYGGKEYDRLREAQWALSREAISGFAALGLKYEPGGRVDSKWVKP